MEKLYQDILVVKEQHEAELLALPHVHAVGIGYAAPDSQQLAIWLHVEPNAPSDYLSDRTEIEGHPLKILRIEQSKMIPTEALEVDGNKYRPLEGGCQILVGPETSGNRANVVGTLGCLAIDRIEAKHYPCILSNHHVLQHTYVFQNSATGGDCIGEVTRKVLSDDVDGGICRINTEHVAKIIDIGEVTGTYDVTINDIQGQGYPIRKRGRTTRLTNGFITQLNLTATVQGSGHIFRNQYFITPTPEQPVFVQGGDSGSVLVNMNNEVVGLLWGSLVEQNSGRVAGAGNTIAKVMDELSIDILTPQNLAEMPAFKTVNQEIKEALSEVPYGNEIYGIYATNKDEVQHTVHHSAKLYAIYKNLPIKEFYETLLDIMRNPEKPIPKEVAGQSTLDMLQKIGVPLWEVSEEPVRLYIQKVLDVLPKFMGAKWKDVLNELEQQTTGLKT